MDLGGAPARVWCEVSEDSRGGQHFTDHDITQREGYNGIVHNSEPLRV